MDEQTLETFRRVISQFENVEALFVVVHKQLETAYARIEALEGQMRAYEETSDSQKKD